LRRVRTTTLAAFAHQDLPFEELVNTLERERPHRAVALAQVMIALHNATLRPKMNSRRGLTFEEANPNVLGPLVAPTTFDVCLMLRETRQGIRGSCVYKPDLFDAMTVECLLQDFQEVLQRMVTQPELPISEIHLSLYGKPSNLGA
jgi:non-ribosomal peptide synthetase component F